MGSESIAHETELKAEWAIDSGAMRERGIIALVTSKITPTWTSVIKKKWMILSPAIYHGLNKAAIILRLTRISHYHENKTIALLLHHDMNLKESLSIVTGNSSL